MVREIKLPGGGIMFVEVATASDEVAIKVAESIYKDGSLPDGTRLTGVADAAGMAGQLLRSQFLGLARMATETLKDLGPTELQIEANVTTEQLLHAVEQLPPAEFAAFLVQLLARARGTTSGPAQPSMANNPYLAAAGIFADDAFGGHCHAPLSLPSGCFRIL